MRFSHGLWIGTISSKYGDIELVLTGTADGPKKSQLEAVNKVMPHAGETIERLRRRLPFPFLWKPVRLAPNDQDRVGVQFQLRFFNRLVVLLADPEGERED
ncbi:MAG: hypothetical protein N3A38_10075 [Planctomycetota bacterium]|nr:hypothetical protein [Planctomycetota bacterium]